MTDHLFETNTNTEGVFSQKNFSFDMTKAAALPGSAVCGLDSDLVLADQFFFACP